MKSVRIIIADDHPIIRKGLIDIIDEIPYETHVEEANNGFELLEKLAESDYDLVVLDISMPGMSGLDAIRQIKSFTHKVNIIVFSIYSEEHYAIRFMKAGAAGYLNKESDANVIIEGITTVLQGGMYYSKDILEKYVLSKETHFTGNPHELLSNREYEIMIMIASGTRMADIATELMISTKTVSTHKARILQKMNTSNNIELTKYAVEHNLI